MSRQLNVPGQSWLSVLFVSFAFTAACGGASDALDEAGAGSSFGGSASSPAAAGSPAVAGSGSVAGSGPFGGSGGWGNTAGAGGIFQFGGAGNQLGGSGGAIATGGAGGAKSGPGGSGGSGGAKSGSGGSGGSGGSRSGSGGSAGHAGQATGTGGSGGAAPTWTTIYTKFISNAQYASNCNGSNCHNPGKQKGYDFSTQANGYASVKSNTSQFVSVLSSGSMPQGKTKMPAADLAIVKAWVAAGAQNN